MFFVAAVQSADVTTPTHIRGAQRAVQRPSWPILAWWTALLIVGVGCWWLVGAPDTGARAGRRTGEPWPYAIGPVLVAAAVLLVTQRRVHERLTWPLLLAAGYLACAAWTLALAATDGALWTAEFSTAAQLPQQLLDTLADAGIDGALATTLMCLVGAAATPLAAIAVRSVCDELSARRLVPLLVLAPYALVAGSPDAVALALGAATLAVAAAASERGRPAVARLMLALLCGLLLGTAALFGYVAALLAAGVVCVFFVRRRPLLNVATAAGFFVPLLVAQSQGLDWTEDVATALRNDSGENSYLSGLVAAAVVLLILGGPALIASLRSMRTTPGWPFLVAGGTALVASVVVGLVSDRLGPVAWLPALPWLVVAAIAPPRQGGPSVPTPVPVVAVGAAAAYALALLIA